MDYLQKFYFWKRTCQERHPGRLFRPCRNRLCKQRETQSINETINQSINQSIKQTNKPSVPAVAPILPKSILSVSANRQKKHSQSIKQ
jgi:hypothetical protein